MKIKCANERLSQWRVNEQTTASMPIENCLSGEVRPHAGVP
jgi:hypothetical protein